MHSWNEHSIKRTKLRGYLRHKLNVIESYLSFSAVRSDFATKDSLYNAAATGLEIVSCAAPHITYYINTISPQTRSENRLLSISRQTLLSQLLSIDLSEPCPQAGACLLSSTRNICGLAADTENV
jgi:hypothetical protein